MGRWMDGWTDRQIQFTQEKKAIQLSLPGLSDLPNLITIFFIGMSWTLQVLFMSQCLGFNNANVSAFLDSFAQIIIFIENCKLECSAHLFLNNSGDIRTTQHVLLSKIIQLIFNIKQY